MAETITFESILNRLKKKKSRIAISIVSIVALVMAFTFIMPYTYMANSSIMPPEKTSGGSLNSFLQNVSGMIDLAGGGQADSRSKLMKSILSSRSVAEKVYDKLDLKNNILFKEYKKQDVIAYIPTLFEVEVEKSGIIMLNGLVPTGYLPNDNEKKAASELSYKITNVAIDALNEVLVEKNSSTARNSKLYVENEIKKYKKELDSVSTQLEQFQSDNKVLALEEQTTAIVSQVIELNSLLTETKTKLNLAKLEYSENSPQVAALESQVEFLQKQSNQLQAGNDDEFSISLNKVPKLSREYMELFRDKKIIMNVLTYLETQKHQEAIQEEKDIPVVQVLDTAIEPRFKYSPSRGKILFISTFISTVIVLLIFMIVSYYEIRKEMETSEI
ncbi:MAG: Wzz/FepE/Etk N-terminal domain-containing protein [Candidatus Kapaibacterium sp.]